MLGTLIRLPERELANDMSHLMDEFFADFRKQPLAPQIEVHDADKHYEIVAEIPGIKESDVLVEVGRDFVKIAGEKHAEKREENDGRTYTERSFGKFKRTIKLRSEIDRDSATATFERGLLRIHLPKTVSHELRQVPVKASTP